MGSTRCWTYLLPLVVLVAAAASAAAAEPVSGRIVFSDSTEQQFLDFKYFDGRESETYIRIEYNNSDRRIPVEKLRSLEVLSYEVEYSNSKGWRIKDVTVKVETTTGAAVTAPVVGTLQMVTIKLSDELTGEQKDQMVLFVRDRKLNIKTIYFDNG